MKIQESAENYLETILMLEQSKGRVRSIDIAVELGFSKPSVSVAMKQLRENGYVEMTDGNFLLLTDKGREFGIEAEKRLSEKGNEYEVFFYGERAQRGIVEWLWEKI